MSGPAIKVLLIDDDESAFIITRSLLAKSPLTSYGLDWVDTYEAGLQALLAGQHDVYLIDYHLHARNGLDLMREVLAQGCTAPMILLTGQGDWETDLEATRAGAADYLQKGEFDAHSLERSIRYALAHRCAADLLRRREKYFRTLLENTSDLVTVIDRDGMVLYQSPSSRALLGRSPHSMNGRSLWKWIAPEDLAVLHRAYQAAWRGEGVLPCLEVRLQHDNGSWRTFEVVGNSFEFDSGVEQMRPGDWWPQVESFHCAPQQAMVLTLHDVTDRKRVEDALQNERDFNAALLDVAGSLIVVLDCQGRIVRFNRSCEEISGYTAGEVQGQPFWDIFLLPEESDEVREAFMRLTQGRFPAYHENHWCAKDGTCCWIGWSNTVLLDDNGIPEYIIATGIDMTARRQAESALLLSEERFRTMFDNTVEGIYQTSPDGSTLYANAALARILGFDSVPALQEYWQRAPLPVYVEDGVREEFFRHLENDGQVVGFESPVLRNTGEAAWIVQNARIVRDADGKVAYYEGTISDITARKQAEARLLHNAFHDELTALPNRTLFMDRLQQTIERSRRHQGSLFAVLFVDFDRFKVINDSLGHATGDRLLKAIARRLEECLRPGDTVARLGGDEFAILLEEVRSDVDAIEVAERLQSILSQSFDLKGQHVFISASVGISIGIDGEGHPDAAHRAEEMLRNADMAMYRAKQQGRARHEVFDREMHVRAVSRLQVETDLRWAIERGELRLHYQPIVNLKSGRIVGFEALVRWQHPERGLVAPQDFVSIAEDTGLIVPLGRWVVNEACRQMQQWKRELPSDNGYSFDNVSMSVNLSSKQLVQPGLLEHIDGCLTRSEMPARNLKLEITESMIMENTDSASQMLTAAKTRGLQVAMDDFGTGYSSLSYLHQFPIDTLKIDRSFVSRIGQQGQNLEIVRTIVALAHSLGLEVVAEGVETPEQLEFLREMDCDYAQGFLFARPSDGHSAVALLTSDTSW